MEDIKVSVCIICYNHKKYIRDALESVVCQKTDFLYEILICDDCSTDGSQEILREYEKKYPYLIKLILLKKNTKGKETLNETLRKAKGEYIAILEGDDFWCDENKLQMQYDFLKNHKEYSAVVSKLRLVDGKGNEKKQTKKLNLEAKDSTITIESFEKRPYSPFVQSLMFEYKREYLAESEYFVEKNTRYVGDNFMQAMLLFRGPIYVFSNAMATYRYIRNGNNYSSQSLGYKAISLFNTAIAIQELYGKKINVNNLIDGYIGDMILFGWKLLDCDQKVYIRKISVPRKINVIKKMIFLNLLRLKSAVIEDQ